MGEGQLDRVEKQSVIDETKEMVARSNAAFVVGYRGLNVEELTGLRRSLKVVSGNFRVVKNTLARIAFQNTELEPLINSLKGPTAITFSYTEPVAVLKVLTKFAKGQKHLEIKAGMVDERLVTSDDMKTLSDLPAFEVLRGRIVECIQAPALNLVRLTVAPGAQLARVFNAHSKINKLA